MVIVRFTNICSGLFSNFNMIMTGIWSTDKDKDERCNYIVDWSDTNPAFHYGPRGTNVWSALFDTTVRVVAQSPGASPSYDYHISMYTHAGWALTSTNARHSYEPHRQYWRKEINDIWRENIRVKQCILDSVDAFWADHIKEGEGVCGVHVRSLALQWQQATHKYPSSEHFAGVVQSVLDSGKASKVFLATDNQQTATFMKERFGDRLIMREHSLYDMHQDHDALGVDEDPNCNQARDCLMDALLLSRCNHFVHAVSNIATAVLYMNPDLPHTFIEVH